MILITEFMDEVAVNLLKKKYDVYYDSSLVENPNSLIKKILKMKALIVRNKTLVTRELIENAPNLKCVGRLGVGLDNIDLNACKGQNITVYPALGANSHSVAEYVICTSMLLLRKAYFKKKVDANLVEAYINSGLKHVKTHKYRTLISTCIQLAASCTTLLKIHTQFPAT